MESNSLRKASKVNQNQEEPLLGFDAPLKVKTSSLSVLSKHQNNIHVVVVFMAHYFQIPFIYIGFIVIFNFIILYFIGSYILRAVIFPYSNFFVRTYLDSMLNRKFGMEFVKLLEQMLYSIQVMGKIEKKEKNETKKFSTNILDINSKMMTTFELINLYQQINEEIIKKRMTRVSSYFKRITNILGDIKKLLKKFKVSDYKPIGEDVKDGLSLWDVYRKDEMTDTQIDNILSSKVLPDLSSCNQFLVLVKQLEQLVAQFRVQVNKGTSRSCFCCYKGLFGTSQQNLQILKKNFEGKHFMIKSSGGVKIDAMFFPCTCESDISDENPQGTYLNKPTFIMCAPNALMYQQMVTTPNAYWLNFFLKREINVMCWNYRGYGLSTTKCLQGLNPYICKVDAERVLKFMVEKMKLKGKIGVYGRSLGGIASSHLANKYPQIIEALIVDRTFCEFDKLSVARLKGSCTNVLFKILSCNWKAQNSINFANAKCFKVVTCDPRDDVVDNFSNLAVGVANYQVKNKYKNSRWKLFYESLLYLYQMDDKFHRRLIILYKNEKQFSHYSKCDEETFSQINDLSKSGFNEISKIDNHLGFDLSQITPQLRRIQDPLKIYQIIHQIVVMLNDFHGGNISIPEVIGNGRQTKYVDFIDFLQSLELYGCGYWDDVDKFKYRERANASHQETAIKELSQLLDIYEISIRQFQESKRFNLGIPNQLAYSNILNLLKFQRAQFKELLDIQQKKEKDSDFQPISQGHLVMLNCGHRGKPTRPEEKRISRLLRKSGFIPMLEEVHFQKFDNSDNLHFDRQNENHVKPLDRLESIHRSKVTQSLRNKESIGGGLNQQPQAKVLEEDDIEEYEEVQEQVKDKLPLV